MRRVGALCIVLVLLAYGFYASKVIDLVGDTAHSARGLVVAFLATLVPVAAFFILDAGCSKIVELEDRCGELTGQVYRANEALRAERELNRDLGNIASRAVTAGIDPGNPEGDHTVAAVSLRPSGYITSRWVGSPPPPPPRPPRSADTGQLTVPVQVNAAAFDQLREQMLQLAEIVGGRTGGTTANPKHESPKAGEEPTPKTRRFLL